jgi:hypothetical protein
MANPKTIILNTQVALGAAQQILAFLRTSVPAVAAMAGPIGLGLSAAVSILLPLIEALVQAGVMSIDEQASLEAEVIAILVGRRFTEPQWQPRPPPPPPAV